MCLTKLLNSRIFKISFTGDANSTFFNEGQRNIGLPLHADCIEANQELYLKMAEEGICERKGEK